MKAIRVRKAARRQRYGESGCHHSPCAIFVDIMMTYTFIVISMTSGYRDGTRDDEIDDNKAKTLVSVL
eukprot:scaffold334345_cov28-Prasinocladus_malaysianus.AAC.2